MIERTLAAHLRALARRHPVVTVTGPRQSGKTTLCRSVFADLPYASLEAPDVREFAIGDPRGFLAQFRDGAVFDEVQRAPQILSYIQGIVDERRRSGQYVLTGSQHFGLSQALSQSLAGRTAVAHLLPLAREEVRRFRRHPLELASALFAGGYPAVFDRGLPPAEWLSSYLATYVERDVRQVLNVGDLLAFQTFLRLCAGRTGQLLNLSALGADAGVSHNTAKAWLSVLEASFVAFRLPPFHGNLRKRLVKTPKLHFYDTGLLCHLLGIRRPEELAQHPLRGAVFESWVASEIVKARANRGVSGGVLFYRDRKGLEVDLLVEGRELTAVEAKSGRTVADDFWVAIEAFDAALGPGRSRPRVRKLVVYGGDAAQRRTDVHVVPWDEIDRCEWVDDSPLTSPTRSATPRSSGRTP